MREVSVRPATAADLHAIHAIAHCAWPVAYGQILSPDQLAYMLERMYALSALREQVLKGHRYLLAEADGGPIGFAGYEHAYRSTRHTRLHKLYVLPEVKGLGVGRALLGAVASAARAAGDDHLELNVNRFNPARHWYARQGFQIVRDEVIDIGQGYVMDDHVMERPLV
ncbi:MAG: GNAT family N-acetyltransferase [Flavobacteriales bacterium]|nr:GNAT family N-acetyltransferase [Flavobacteriales bacterium]